MWLKGSIKHSGTMYSIDCLNLISSLPMSTHMDFLLHFTVYVAELGVNGTLHKRSNIVNDFTPKCVGIKRGKPLRGKVFPRLIPTHEGS